MQSTKPNILQPVSLQLSSLSPHVALLGRAKLWSKGESAKESLGQNEYSQLLHWKVLVTVCLEVSRKAESTGRVKARFVCVVELVGIPSKACDTSSLQQNI